MKAMAALDAITDFLSNGCPAGGAKKVQPLATSGAERRLWPILQLTLGTDHAATPFPDWNSPLTLLYGFYYNKPHRSRIVL
jgi:hypothetical protein